MTGGPLSSELGTFKTRQSRPGSGLDSQVKVDKTFLAVPSSLDGAGPESSKRFWAHRGRVVNRVDLTRSVFQVILQK